jgi:hypothetical protein
MSQIQKYPKIKNIPNSKMSQIQKYPKFKNVPNSKISQIQKYPKFKNVANLKMSQIQKCRKFKNVPNSKIPSNTVSRNEYDKTQNDKNNCNSLLYTQQPDKSEKYYNKKKIITIIS